MQALLSEFQDAIALRASRGKGYFVERFDRELYLAKLIETFEYAVADLSVDALNCLGLLQ